MFFFFFFLQFMLYPALMVLLPSNAIISVFYLIIVFLSAAGILLWLKVEFLAMVLLVVYVGAIAILFLFVVMMLNTRDLELNSNFYNNYYVGIGLFFSVWFFSISVTVLKSSLLSYYPCYTSYFDIILWLPKIDPLTNIEAFSKLLYTYYFPLFIIAGLVLLVSMIGSIVLTINHKQEVKRQRIFEQINRYTITKVSYSK